MTSYVGKVYDVAGAEAIIDLQNPTLDGNEIIADTIAPTLTELTITEPTQDGIYPLGTKVKIVATFDETIYDSNKSAIVSEIAPELKIKFGNSEERTVTFSNSNETQIEYEYTITTGDNGVLVITSYQGEVYDLVGNKTTLSLTSPTFGGTEVEADSEPPTLQPEDKFLKVNGFDEKLKVAFNDVDLNLKIL